MLLGVGQCIISLTGCIDLGLAVQSDGTDGINELFNSFRCFFVPVTKALTTLFLGVVIGIVEHDDITILHGLLRNTQVRMGTVQRVHPAGIAAVGKFSDAVDRFHIVTSRIAASHTGFCQCLVQHILDGGTGSDLIGLLRNPGTQIAASQGMHLVGAVLGAAQQGEGNGNRGFQFIQLALGIRQGLVVLH